MNHNEHTMNHEGHNMKSGGHYKKLLWMVILSFVSMYVLMYSMVNSYNNALPNINQFYMAGLMTMPMIIIELLLMRSMYMNKKLNTIILAVSAVLLIGFYLFIRQQTAVGDRQFVRGMIPHHAAAILMAKKANLSDPEIKKLAEEIISSQEKEIADMKAFLDRQGK